jgi:hypothetical protein
MPEDIDYSSAMPFGPRRLSWWHKATVPAIVFLCCVVGILVERHVAYLHPSQHELMVEVAARSAVLCSAARIERDEPQLGGWVKQNSIVLIDPVIVDALPAQCPKCRVVVADDPFFAGDVSVAIHSRKELNADWNAIMGANVRIVDLSPDRSPKVVDSAYVTFIEIRFK